MVFGEFDIYTVKPGNTLWSIATHCNMTVRRLMELGNSPDTKEVVPLLTINQNNTFEVKITNNSTSDKHGMVGIFMNGRVIGNSNVRIPRKSTKTITLDMSVPGPGAHTLKVSVSGDSGGRFSKVEIFNVGTERITAVHIKAVESNDIIIDQPLRFPSFLPPGGTVTFTANYAAHVAGEHTIKFELDPNKTEFNRTALMNAIGEDLIETVTGKWLPRIGDKIWVCGKKIKKGDLPEEANKHINSNIPVQVGVILTIIGVALNPLNGILLAGITISLALNDYNQDNLAKKFNNFATSLKGKSDDTPVYISTELKYVQKGSQGYFWIPTGEIKISLTKPSYCD
ncbi:LysM peptidoglycan-binding domain-containing protein [Lutibacter sp. B2]|nr:LysM peptidoglycan-binding domain-containing protein [Lutibacter sp. B2]